MLKVETEPDRVSMPRNQQDFGYLGGCEAMRDEAR